MKCNATANNKGKVSATIDCHSYRTVQHTTYVPVRGGDGHTHDVPVVWYEYIPITKSTPISVVDACGHTVEDKKQTIESICKKFGIKSIYKQKGISLHMGSAEE